MNQRFRTFGAYLLLLAFVLGGVVAPHVHQARHAAEAITAAHEQAHCEDASHDSDAPLVTGHFHEAEIPECVLCATHHTFTAVVPDEGSSLELLTRPVDRAMETHVLASPRRSTEIRGPPVWAA